MDITSMSRRERGNARRPRTEDGEAVPIEIVDRPSRPARRVDGSRLLYPATLDDLRGVMARLPPGALDGIAGIELAEWRGEFHRLLRGVVAPATCSMYVPDERCIRLFAYRVDTEVPNRGHVELYLRLAMLAALCHEVGRHHEHGWVRSVVVPYLEDAYPDDVAALRQCMIDRIGVAIPLDLVAQRSHHLLGASEALHRVLAASGPASTDERLHVAFRLYADHHLDLALAVIDHVLASEPQHAEALADRAQVLRKLDRVA